MIAAYLQVHRGDSGVGRLPRAVSILGFLCVSKVTTENDRNAGRLSQSMEWLQYWFSTYTDVLMSSLPLLCIRSPNFSSVSLYHLQLRRAHTLAPPSTLVAYLMAVERPIPEVAPVMRMVLRRAAVARNILKNHEKSM